MSIYLLFQVDYSDGQNECVLDIRRMVAFGWAQSLKGTTNKDFRVLVKMFLDLGVDYLCVFRL